MKNIFYHILGIGILFLNKIRYAVKGYTSPKPINFEDIEGSISYDFDVVKNWEYYIDS